jgi:hypothetical protein
MGNSGFLNEEFSIFADDFRLNLGVPAGTLGNTASLDILIGGIGGIKSCSLSWKPPPRQMFATTLYYAFE